MATRPAPISSIFACSSRHVAPAAAGVGVAAVQEGVDEDLGQAGVLGLGDDAVQVVGVRMDAAGGDQAQQVQAAGAVHGPWR